MKLYNWDQLPAEQMNAQIVRKVVHTEQMTIARLNIMKDAVVPEHAHINEQVANVALRGAQDQVVCSGADHDKDRRAG